MRKAPKSFVGFAVKRMVTIGFLSRYAILLKVLIIFSLNELEQVEKLLSVCVGDGPS